MTSTSAPAVGHAQRGRIRSLLHSLWRGRETDAAWVRPALLGLLVLTAGLYLWDLSINGWANSFYSAAVQAGSQDWKAFFFGSSDMGNSITVDKPPASLWIMALSVRLFGLNSWSILVPQALMGVATVWLTYAIVRRHFSAVAGLAAGLIAALTPVATLMFRFNNPDALLLLLVTVSVYWTLRALEDGRTRWLVYAGVAVGFGFLTKQLQAFLILPALAGVFLAFGPGRILKRLWQSLIALGAVIVGGGWWVAIVELWPADSRPYIGGSQNNSFLELTFGYNGFGRLTGEETGSVTPGGTSQWGETGIFRLFGSDFAGQIAWLLPAALVLTVIGIILTWKKPRTDLKRALLVLASGWLLITWLAFSFMAGIFHQYYTVALVVPIAIIVAIVGEQLWELRAKLWARIVAAIVVAGSALWAWVILNEASDFVPWLKWVVVGAGIIAAASIVLLPWHRWMLPLAAAATGLALLAGPVSFSLDTIGTSHTGSIVTAGPTVSGTGTGFGTGFGGGQAGGAGTGFGGGQGGQAGRPSGRSDDQTGNPGASQDGQPTGQMGDGTPPAGAGSTDGQPPTGAGQSSRGQSVGSLVGGSANSEVVPLLEEDGADYTWAAATIGSTNAAEYQLASGYAVMPIGGFNGSDPSPTLEEFQQYVAEGKIHYFISSSVSGASNGGSDTAEEISTWVSENFTAQTVGSTTVYDLTTASSAA